MYPKINQNIVIDILKKELSCRTLVADIQDSEILIGSPMDGKAMGELVDGMPLEISYVVNDNQYKFSTEVLGRKKDNILLYRVKKPAEKEIVKIQRREDFRVSAVFSVRIKGYECSGMNISSGGMLVSCKNDMDLQPNELIRGTFNLPSSKEPAIISFEGQIRRIGLAEGEERKMIGIQFTQIIKADQTRILQFCFEKQREMRQMRRV